MGMVAQQGFTEKRPSKSKTKQQTPKIYILKILLDLASAHFSNLILPPTISLAASFPLTVT